MAILDFQKPDKVIMIQSDTHDGQFEFRPLEPGYGITIGNALRRILLSSLEGYAIASVKVDGVDHEFSTLKCVIEDNGVGRVKASETKENDEHKSFHFKLYYFYILKFRLEFIERIFFRNFRSRSGFLFRCGLRFWEERGEPFF
jgi:hypothetical protein